MTTLLVIDEEANTRLLFRDEFQNEGYLVTAAETTQKAMNIIQHCKPDIITLGIKMPGTEGIEFLRKVKAEENDIPVVLCSAYASYKYDVRVRDCDAFVVRSADFNELKTIIKKILSYKRPVYARKARAFMEADRHEPLALTDFSRGFTSVIKNLQ
jgi:DNA-binding NtrC family response regulator